MAKGKFHRWLEQEGLTLIEGWARKGLTDVQISHNMGISVTTLSDWKKRFPTISKTLKKGKEVADFEVENALYKRALGYTIEELTVEDSEKDGHKEKRVQRHIPADVTAQIYWLKNRNPEFWRDKPKEVKETEQIEDDGLLDALKADTELFEDGDDSEES